jgi:uncharacterized protein (DUF1697 family)
MPGAPTHAAFLRGMNVGGHRLTNAELQGHLSAIGLREVATFRASGNVVFLADASADDAVRELIESGLEAKLGYAVPSFIRSAEEVRAIAAQQPFSAKQLAASSGKLQVSLLLESPSAGVRDQVLALADRENLLSFGARELYWLPSGGILDSALDLKSVERLLSPTTTRTKGTIEQIASKYFAG